MLVRIEEIHGSGLALNEPVPRAVLDEIFSAEPKETGFALRGEPRLKAHLSRVGNGVLLEGELTVELAAACKRCLSELSLSVPVRFTLNLVAQPQPKGEAGEGDDDHRSERGGTFDLADVDLETFDGKTIDLDPILREQVMLALPVSVVCREDCKGLCPVCGQNLNEKECGCERKVIDPRLAVLKEIKLS